MNTNEQLIRNHIQVTTETQRSQDRSDFIVQLVPLLSRFPLASESGISPQALALFLNGCLENLVTATRERELAPPLGLGDELCDDAGGE